MISDAERDRKRASVARQQLPEFFKQHAPYVVIKNQAIFRDGSTALRVSASYRDGGKDCWEAMTPAKQYTKRERAENKARYWEAIKNKAIRAFDSLKAQHENVKEFFGDAEGVIRKLERLRLKAKRAHAKWQRYDDRADSLAPVTKKNSREAARERVKRKTEKFRKRLDAIEL
jgi:hypothetical protein